ncbi:MAG: sulfur oxidation c-type cytochrome SoxX [Candidatus Sedimenticola endophacoides]
MTRIKSMIGAAAGLTVLLAGALAQPVAAADGVSAVTEGKVLSEDRKKGNCLACHMMGDGAYPGNIAPPLVAMQSRYPNKEKLRAQIWDATANNPDSPMPPFGKHRIVSDEELDKIVEYVWTL